MVIYRESRCKGRTLNYQAKSGRRRYIGATPKTSEYLRTALFFCVCYALINIATAYHSFGHTQITLWSPDNGLSLLLLLESTLYAPIVAMAAVATDVFIARTDIGGLAVVASELMVTLSYLVVATALRDGFGYDYRDATYPNVIRLLSVVPVAGALTAVTYCGSLYLTGGLRPVELYAALRTFWIGDAVGMIVLMPAATAVYDLLENGGLRRRWRFRRIAVAAVVAIGLTTLVLASVGLPDSRYLFNLLFLPTIWVGISYGFQAVTLSLLATQLILIAAMTHYDVSDFNFGVIQMQMFVLAATGQLLGAAISEREEARRVLSRQQTDLTRISAQATTGVLAVAFAHEISQPLSSLSGYVHAARRLLAGRADLEPIANALERAEVEARRTRDIIARIRDFVATGALELTDVDLVRLTREIVAVNSDDARTRNAAIHLAAPATPVPVRLDRIAIEQALNNIVLNAIETSPEGATTPRNVWVRLTRDGSRARLEIEDDGPGIAPELVERLFQPFATTKPRGMGLGLALSTEVLGKHGGTLAWSAREPHGACFSVSLPLAGPHDDSQ